jgi:hypothetical protein
MFAEFSVLIYIIGREPEGFAAIAVETAKGMSIVNG